MGTGTGPGPGRDMVMGMGPGTWQQVWVRVRLYGYGSMGTCPWVRVWVNSIQFKLPRTQHNMNIIIYKIKAIIFVVG